MKLSSYFPAASLLATSFSPLVDASPLSTRATSRQTYINHSVNATGALSQYYSTSNGLYSGMWWQSANTITTLAGLAQIDLSFKSAANSIFQTTYSAAKKSNGNTWLNNYYDDEGWWAMAWIKVYDVTGDSKYLTTAENIFVDLLKGVGTPCGGQWWSKDKDAINSINNELLLAVAASLANRVNSKRDEYAGYANTQANFLHGANLLSSNNSIVDGLTPSTCKPEGMVFSYNQGVILGAYVEIYKLTGDSSWLNKAAVIADGAIKNLNNGQGILTEKANYPTLGATSATFKGVFARNLALLQGAQPNSNYVTFLQQNADSIWTHDRNSEGQLGANWQGPVSDVSASSQTSAFDYLVAAAIVST